MFAKIPLLLLAGVLKMPRVSNSLKDYGVLEVECKRKSDSENDFLLGVLDFLNNQQWFYFELY